MNKPQIEQKSVQGLIDKELDEGRGIDQIVERFKNCVLVRALDRCDYNQSRTAELLKTHRNSVVRWIQEYGLHDQVRHEYLERL